MDHSDFSYGQCLHPSSHLQNQLWISGKTFALNELALKRHKISAILSLVPLKPPLSADIPILTMHINDHPDESIEQELHLAYDFIQKRIKEGNVLVCCQAGISRSAICIIFYLMRTHAWSYEKCEQQLKKSRKWIKPNTGFIEQCKRQIDKCSPRIPNANL